MSVVKLTVEAADGALIARLDGYRPGVLDADRAADLFFDAVLAALQPGDLVDAPVEPATAVDPAGAETAPGRGAAEVRQVDPPRTPHRPGRSDQGTSCVAASGSAVAQHGPAHIETDAITGTQLLAARPEALRRLDEGEAISDVAHALGVPVAIVRRWDADPSVVA